MEIILENSNVDLGAWRVKWNWLISFKDKHLAELQVENILLSPSAYYFPLFLFLLEYPAGAFAEMRAFTWLIKQLPTMNTTQNLTVFLQCPYSRWQESNFSSQCHNVAKQKGHENNENDHQWNSTIALKHGWKTMSRLKVYVHSDLKILPCSSANVPKKTVSL